LRPIRKLDPPHAASFRRGPARGEYRVSLACNLWPWSSGFGLRRARCVVVRSAKLHQFRVFHSGLAAKERFSGLLAGDLLGGASPAGGGRRVRLVPGGADDSGFLAVAPVAKAGATPDGQGALYNKLGWSQTASAPVSRPTEMARGESNAGPVRRVERGRNPAVVDRPGAVLPSFGFASKAEANPGRDRPKTVREHGVPLRGWRRQQSKKSTRPVCAGRVVDVRCNVRSPEARRAAGHGKRLFHGTSTAPRALLGSGPTFFRRLACNQGLCALDEGIKRRGRWALTTS